MGGFNLSTVNSNGTTGCKRSSLSTVVNAATADYIPHHNWFQYFQSTANPKHARPASIAAIGHSDDPANHEYDLQDFYDAVKGGDFPAVSYIKMDAYQDGHAGYSDPLDEQNGTAKVVNFIEQQPDWKNTAIFLLWDDSDGWYDHVKPATFDYFEPGFRIPMVIVSPYAKRGYISHHVHYIGSILHFIEHTYGLGSLHTADARSDRFNDCFDFAQKPLPYVPVKLPGSFESLFETNLPSYGTHPQDPTLRD